VAKPAALQASDVGITPTTIRIAVIADVDNSIAPGLFKGSVDGVQGFAKYINAHGGLAGRKVQVDFIDSHLNPNEARNAVITACSQDFALVGTSAALLTTVTAMTACPDKTGAVTGIPDLAYAAFSTAQACSPVSFSKEPSPLDCTTKDQHPQSYRAGVGRAYYYEKHFGNDLHGVYVGSADSKGSHDGIFAGPQGQMRSVGIKADQDFNLSSSATQTAYTPVVQAIKTNNSNYAQSGLTYQSSVLLRKEAEIQGVTSVKVWDCFIACYDPGFLQAGGSAVEGEFIDLPYLPSNETKSNAMLANYVKYTGKANLNGFSIDAFAAGVLLRDAVQAATKSGGNNALTRKAVLSALNNTHKFDADGMVGVSDVGARAPTPCFMLMQVQNGQFKRVYPKKPGTLDCNKRNLVTNKLDLLQ
jgi:ABC-type branched-subunit amino acid transport system substrate-binding protein